MLYNELSSDGLYICAVTLNIPARRNGESCCVMFFTRYHATLGSHCGEYSLRCRSLFANTCGYDITSVSGQLVSSGGDTILPSPVPHIFNSPTRYSTLAGVVPCFSLIDSQ